jgi:hypothetical protein
MLSTKEETHHANFRDDRRDAGRCRRYCHQQPQPGTAIVITTIITTTIIITTTATVIATRSIGVTHASLAHKHSDYRRYRRNLLLPDR